MRKILYTAMLTLFITAAVSCGDPDEAAGGVQELPEEQTVRDAGEEAEQSREEEPARYFGVTLDVLNEDGTAEIFSEPHMDAEIIRVLPDGEEVELLKTVPYGWYAVKLRDGTEGYADARTVRTETIPPHDFSPDSEPGYTLVFTHQDQRLRIYHDGEQLLSAPGSSGTDELYTPRGVYRLEENRRGEWWFSEEFQMGLKYWVGFRGIWLFHSVPYTRKGELIQEEADKLGNPASHGCIRLPPETAKYIYEMVPPGSLVLIY
ncbi:MAG: L,D-transpeptidase family protein [Spirochaetia bacterium]